MQHALKGLVAALAMGLAALPEARAQSASDYPNRPVTLIIPFAAGVTADLLFRGYAERASKYLGQPIIVDNKPGASATLGPAAMAASAKPDGYTIAQIAVTLFRVPVMQKVAYDPIRDFTYIVMLGGYSLGGVVAADGPFKKWQDVLDFAKANPGKFTYTTIGAGTTNAVATELMARHSGVKLTHIPSKGGGEGIAGVLGGHYTMMVESPVWGSQIESGKMRGLFTLGSKRLKKFPDIPTMLELGYPFAFDSPFGLVGPKGMDPAIVAKIHDAFKKAYDEKSLDELYERFDFVRMYADPAGFTAWATAYAKSEREALERLGLARKD